MYALLTGKTTIEQIKCIDKAVHELDLTKSEKELWDHYRLMSDFTFGTFCAECGSVSHLFAHTSGEVIPV